MAWRTAAFLILNTVPLFAAERPNGIRIAVELRDGSRLVGTSPPLVFRFVQDDGKRMQLSTANIAELTAEKDRELCTLQLADRTIRGVVELKKLSVRGVFGTVDVPFGEITRVRFVQLRLGLLAHYPFDGDCKDASGNGNHGRPHHKVAFARGVIGKAAAFDGNKDFISVVPRSDVSKIKDFTISAWVFVKEWKTQPAQFGVDLQYVFDGFSIPAKGIYYGNGFGLQCEGRPASDHLSGNVTVDEKNTLTYTPSTRLLRRWRLLTFLRKNNREFTYIDGKLVTPLQSYTIGTTHRPLDMRHTWFIGTYAGNDPNIQAIRAGFRYGFRGRIDDLRIYRRALNPLEVQALARAGKGANEPRN